MVTMTATDADWLGKAVQRTGWEVFSFVWMPNHIHLFFRTPIPNLSKGMQYLLSGYANSYAKRHQRGGTLLGQNTIGTVRPVPVISSAGLDFKAAPGVAPESD